MKNAKDENMNSEYQIKRNQFAKAHKTRKKWLTVAASLCAVVFVGTSYLLMNPASTQQQETFCGLEEHKAHTDSCYKKVLVCQLPEEGHKHSESCYEEQQILICELPETEGHTHSDACFAEEAYLSCGLEETEGHMHGEECYETEAVLICGDESEDHIHTDECYEERAVLTCELTECEPHHHDESCQAVRQVLICGQEESEPHTHGEGCYETRQECICGLEECGPHTHGEECYQIDVENPACGHEIHVHTLQCFSNPDADAETEAAWEQTFAEVELSGNRNEDILAIAKTQLGYTESKANYKVQEDGTSMNGYTRYGAWYGLPYDDWSTLFCAFCLHYAGGESEIMPFSPLCAEWVDWLSAEGVELYRSADAYVPVPGDLVFFDDDSFDPEQPEDREADRAGIVAELVYDEETEELTKIKVIEGDYAGAVCMNSCELTDLRILGYAEIPEKPADIREITSEPAADGAVAVISGVLPEGAVATIEAVTLSGEELAALVGEAQAALMKSYVAYDIKIMVDGEEWQPDETVSVAVKQTGLTVEENDNLAIAHVDGDTNEVSGVEAEISADGEISFPADGFSLYIIYTYTVDFHYGGLTFSINGTESILLSELFTRLGISASAAEVAGVSFTDSTLLRVEQVEGDWLLTSLAPFDTDEILTLSFADESTLEIKVTDANDPWYDPVIPDNPCDTHLTESAGNDWQIVAEGYAGNDLDDKVSYNGGGTNPEVYLQKNVVPTNNENEFLVYLSLSRPASMEDWVRNASFAILENKNPDFSFQSGSPKKGPLYKLEELPPEATGLNDKYILINIYDTLTYDNQGNVTAYGTKLSTFGIPRKTAVSTCSNGSVYILIPELNGYIKIVRGVNFHTGEGGQGNPFVVNISMAQISSTIGMATENVVFDTVTDVLGDNMEFVTDDSGSPIVYKDGEVEIAPDGRSFVWTPAENPGTEKVYSNSGKLSCILNNNAQLVYKVRLKTETDGFASCADSETGDGLSSLPTADEAHSDSFDPSDYNAYGTNSCATLTYHKEPMSGGSGTPSASRSPSFYVPYVRGLLYDLSFKKVADDEENTPLEGAKFKLKLDDGSYLEDENGEDRIFETGENGLLDPEDQEDLFDLPQSRDSGVVGVEEVEAPPFYEIPDENPWTIPLNYTAATDKTVFTPDVLNGKPQNMRYTSVPNSADEWQIVNTREPGQSIVFKKLDADTSEPLKGVTFALYASDGSGEMNDEPLSGYGALTSDQNGIFSPDSFMLSDGTYFLKEVRTRKGYQALAEPIQIVVADGEVTVSGTDGSPAVSFAEGIYTLTVQNEKVSSQDPVPPGDPEYVPDDPADVTLKKQIDWLGDSGTAGTEDLYRLYLSLETGNIEPMDLLLVIDQSGSMAEYINYDDIYFDIDLDDFEYDDDYGCPVYSDENTGYFLVYDYDEEWIYWIDDEGDWWECDGYDEEKGWYVKAGSGATRQEALLEFLNGTETDHSDGFISVFREANEENRLAVLTFSSDCSYDTDSRYIMQWDDTDLFIDPSDPVGATNYAAALDIADQVLDEAADSTNRKVMIFLSDGVPTIAYADGKMHHSFDNEGNGTLAVGYGNDYSYSSVVDYVYNYVFLFGVPNGEVTWNSFINGNALNKDDYGSPQAKIGCFVDPFALGKSPKDHWPVTYDFTTIGLEIPGTNFPEYGVTDQTAFDAFIAMWNGLSEDQKLAWVTDNMIYPGDAYDLFYLSESAYAEFSENHSDVPVFTLFFSDDADTTLDSGRAANEVLKYMSGDDHPDAPSDRYHHFRSCNSAEALADAILSIVGLSNVEITDTLSEYVDFISDPDPAHADWSPEKVSQLEIKLTNGTYSTYEGYPYLYQNGAFTSLGEQLLDTDATKIDSTARTVSVKFKPDVTYAGEFTCEASFNVLVNDTAYKAFAQSGNQYPAEGDLGTDYPDNATSSEKPGFYSNDGAEASWTYYGTHDDDYKDPVVQVRLTDIQLKKVTVENSSQTLEGAKFDLYRVLDAEEGSDIAYTEGEETYYLQKINTEALVSDSGGIVAISNLRVGQYYLFETKAPDGYYPLKKPVAFKVVLFIEDGEVEYKIVSPPTDEYSAVDETDERLLLVKNSSGYEMPNTGGSGTALYTLGGLLLVFIALASGWMLRQKRYRLTK